MGSVPGCERTERRGASAGVPHRPAHGVEERVREYDIGRHTVYCHYTREVVRIPEPTEGRMVVFLDGSGVEGQQSKAGAAAIQVKGVGQETESIVDKVVYGAASHGEVETVADVVGKLGEDVQEVWMVVDAEADMASLRRLANRPLHEALGTGLAPQVYTIWHGLEMRKVPLVIHLVKQESHRAGVGNHEADGAAQAVDKEQEPEWGVPERRDHLHLIHIPPRRGDEETLGARLKPNVVAAKLFQCSRLSGRNKKSSEFVCPPTKPTRTWWQNMLFASLGGPRLYAYICGPARSHVKKTCFQQQFLLEHHWNTAGISYLNVAGTSNLQ